MRTIQLFIILLSFSATSWAAEDLNLKGKLLDQNTKAPLMFANLSIKGYAIGTATDIEGNFKIEINEQYFKDSLVISMIGYETQTIAIKSLLDQKGEAIFLLAPTSFEFAIVEVGAPMILNDISFEFNKHQLLPVSFPSLKKLFNYLEKHPDYKIEISGHTDDVGSDEYNLALSEARAGAVMAWLEENGIPQSSMSARGYGETMPIATNETELGQEQNRRVEFKVIEKGFNPMTDNPIDKKKPKKEEKKDKSEDKPKPKKDDEVIKPKPKKDLLIIGGQSKNPEPKPKKEEEEEEEENPKAIFQPKEGFDASDLKNFKPTLETALAGRDFHGVVLVTDAEKPIFQKIYGKANLTYDVANQATTRFYIGSLAEQFTTVLALKLVQQNKIALTDPIGRFLPNYPNNEAKKQITIGHLLSHTSGLVHESKTKAALEMDGMSFDHDSYIKSFASKATTNTPGTAYAYSGLNYYLMAVIIEKVYQNDFESVLKKEIFDKTNMIQTQFLDLTNLDKNRARNYQETANGIKTTVLSPKNLILGSSNIISTLADLQQWDKAIRSNALLDETHTNLLLKENLEGESFMGKIDKGGWRTNINRQAGCEVIYTYAKNFSMFVISNVENSGAKIIYGQLKKPF